MTHWFDYCNTTESDVLLKVEQNDGNPSHLNINWYGKLNINWHKRMVTRSLHIVWYYAGINMDDFPDFIKARSKVRITTTVQKGWSPKKKKVGYHSFLYFQHFNELSFILGKVDSKKWISISLNQVLLTNKSHFRHLLFSYLGLWFPNLFV